MNERAKFYEATKPPASTVDLELQKKITAAESRLAILAQVVGADFGMKVKFGQLGGGSFFDPETNGVTLDPQILLEDKEYLGEFVSGHEGGHRAITRSLEQIGVAREKAMELYGKIGFGYANNCLEDCADNNWVGEIFPKFKQDSDRVYAEQFSHKNAIMTTPEINKLIARLGYVPKFVSCGSEIIRLWATGEHGQNLDAAVADVLARVDASAEEYYQSIPGPYSREGERLKRSKDRFKVFFEKIWPEFENLVKMDIDEEKLRQLADKLNRQNGESGEGGKPSGKTGQQQSGTDGAGELSPNEKRELSEKAKENLREQIEQIDKELGNLQEKMSKAKNQDEKDEVAKQMAKARGDKDSLQSGEKSAVPWDKLSDELKKKLQEIFDKLPPAAKSELEKAAKKQLEELDNLLIKESRGRLAEDSAPPTHEEIKAAEAKQAEDKAVFDEKDEARRREEIENQKLSKTLREKIEGDLGEYEKIYQEIAPLADELFDRIRQLFLLKRHPRWQRGNPTGQRLDLAKVMQFQADRTLYDKIWERKTIPHKIDYRFTLLVDLSGSMSSRQGGAIEPTFRGTILLSEVLNRLGLKTQILGFQDVPIVYKDFDEELTAEKRKKMTVMRREVDNQGEHNRARYNSDGYCLSEASKLLAKQKGKDNFLVVLSDGQPEPDGAHAGPQYDLTKVIGDIRKNTRQKLIGVGLGPGTEHVGNYYPTALPSLDLQKLPQVLGELLEDMIKYPSKY